MEPWKDGMFILATEGVENEFLTSDNKWMAWAALFGALTLSHCTWVEFRSRYGGVCTKEEPPFPQRTTVSLNRGRGRGTQTSVGGKRTVRFLQIPLGGRSMRGLSRGCLIQG